MFDLDISLIIPITKVATQGMGYQLWLFKNSSLKINPI